MFGCEIQEDGHSSSFWQFGFDGKDHLSLDLETLSWVSAEPMAVRTKRWWESERCYAEYDKAYLEGLCLASLRRYLELGGQSLTRRGKARPEGAEGPCSHSPGPPHLTKKPEGWGDTRWGPGRWPITRAGRTGSGPHSGGAGRGGVLESPVQGWSWGITPLTQPHFFICGENGLSLVAHKVLLGFPVVLLLGKQPQVSGPA